MRNVEGQNSLQFLTKHKHLQMKMSSGWNQPECMVINRNFKK